MKMDLQALMDAFAESGRRERSRYHLTLGALIEALRSAPSDAVVRFDYMDCSPGEPHSYRGYYSDLSFDRSAEPITVSQFLDTAVCCLGGTYEGYKGGDFLMTEDTPLWAASYGCCGRAIVGHHVNNGNVVLLTKEVDL
ncbi:MAG: hypothetical protein ABFE07_06465 [Armatimonadia bacterium]